MRAWAWGLHSINVHDPLNTLKPQELANLTSPVNPKHDLNPHKQDVLLFGMFGERGPWKIGQRGSKEAGRETGGCEGRTYMGH